MTYGSILYILHKLFQFENLNAPKIEEYNIINSRINCTNLENIYKELKINKLKNWNKINNNYGKFEKHQNIISKIEIWITRFIEKFQINYESKMYLIHRTQYIKLRKNRINRNFKFYKSSFNNNKLEK